MLKRNYHCLLFLVTCQIGAHAQQTLSLSLEEAKHYALENNKMVANASHSVTEAHRKILETIATGLPQAEATVDYSNFMGAEMELRINPLAPPQKIPFNPTSNLNISVGQLIFSGSYIIGLQTVKLYRSLAETGYEKTRQEITEQVTRSYLHAIISEAMLVTLKSNAINTRAIFEKTKTAVSAGVADALDADQFEVQLMQLEIAIKSAERQREMANNLLRYQLGVPMETSLTLTDTIHKLLVLPALVALGSTSFDPETNPSFRMAHIQANLTKKQVDLNKMAYLPTLTGFYRHTEKILKPEFDLSPRNVIGLNLSVPLFSSGARTARYSQAKIQYLKALNSRDLAREQLLLQEKQSRYNLLTALEQYENRHRNVEVAERVYQNFQQKHSQGLASGLEVTVAANTYLQAESEYITVTLQVMESGLALQKLLNLLE